MKKRKTNYKRKIINICLFAFILLFTANVIKVSTNSKFYLNHILNTFPVFSSTEEVTLVSSVFDLQDFQEIFMSDEPQTFLPTQKNITELTSFNSMEQYLYAIDETAYADESILNIPKLLDIDIKTKLKSSNNEPKVLIFHTHSQENFIDSREGIVDDTIVGVGSTLSEILTKEYGIGVVHDFGQYDVVDGENVRGKSYERMEIEIKKVLEKYPSIELVIDLHRDGVDENKRLVTTVNGKEVAKLMLFNGLCIENDNGQPKKIKELENPYIEENLALSLKMQLYANEYYPGLMRKLYIKPYRYSLHLAPKTILVEAGANTNTVKEVKDSMVYLAKIIYDVVND